LAPRDPFQTYQAAALDALNWTYQTYDFPNAVPALIFPLPEYAGTIYQGPDGMYYATNPNSGNPVTGTESVPSYPPSIETTQAYTRVTITDLKAAHRRFSSVGRPKFLCFTGSCIKRDVTCIVSPMAAEFSATEAEIWSRTIRAGEGDLSPEAAREWLRLQLSDADAERVRELSSKANSGQLTSIEERELENYLNVGRTLEFLKAKARLSLRGQIPG
jgi:hypothetical protein